MPEKITIVELIEWHKGLYSRFEIGQIVDGRRITNIMFSEYGPFIDIYVDGSSFKSISINANNVLAIHYKEDLP